MMIKVQSKCTYCIVSIYVIMISFAESNKITLFEKPEMGYLNRL